jgi:hypothetical protein
MTLAQFAFLLLYYTNKIYLGFLGIAVVAPRIMVCVRTHAIILQFHGNSNEPMFISLLSD